MVIAQTQRAIGVFSTRGEAEIALNEIRDAGFDMNKVSVIARHAEQDGEMAGADLNKSKSEQVKGGTAAGATAGGATGGIMGLIGGLGVLAIPGVGVAAEVGIVLANTLLGGAFGAVGGGLVGALVGWGIPEDQASYYDERVAAGEYLIMMEGAQAEIRQAEAILHSRGIRDWNVYSSPAPGASPVTGTGVV
jgi:hypothetical protein